MKRFFFTLIILVTYFTNSFCQTNWREGYIIQPKNDSIYGYIDDRGSKSNTQNCYFRETFDSEIIKYSPEDIIGYRFIDGKFYISKRIDDNKTKSPLFLEFLIQGEVNIYHIKVDIDRFFIEKDTLFYELLNTSKIVSLTHKAEGRTTGKDYETQYVKELNEYKGMMNYLMQDADMSQAILQSNFGAKSLIKVSKKYHEIVCQDEECIIYEKPEEKLNVSFRLHAGLSMNYFNFGNLIKSEYSQGSLIGCRFIFNNSIDRMEKINFHLDLTFQKFSDYRLSVEEGYEVVSYENILYRIGTSEISSTVPYIDVNINAIALKTPLTVNYHFLNGKFKPYGGLGLTNVFISQNRDFIYHRYYNEYNKSIPTYQGGFIVKVGGLYEINNNNIYFDLIYENTSNFGKNEYLFKNQLFSFDLGLSF